MITNNVFKSVTLETIHCNDCMYTHTIFFNLFIICMCLPSLHTIHLLHSIHLLQLLHMIIIWNKLEKTINAIDHCLKFLMNKV